MQREQARVGFLVLLALGTLAFGVFLIGDQNNLFRRMNRYVVTIESAYGLQEHNPVQLNGVDVGRVESIVLGRDPSQAGLTIKVAVDRRFAEHVRADSLVRIKTLGLLGDKYVEISAGTIAAAIVPDGGALKAAERTDVDQLISSGEDVVENIVRISSSLSKILDRVERGEGMLGQLLGPVPEGQKDLSLLRSLAQASDGIERITSALENGKSPVARLLLDENMGAKLSDAVERFDQLAITATEGPGLVPSLIHDEALKHRIERTLENLEQASQKIATAAASLETSEGLLPKLIGDEVYAEQLMGEMRQMIERLNKVAGALESGQGTAGKLLKDDSVYQALDDLVVGVNDSKILSWLIKNRQRAGIKKKFLEQGSVPEASQPQEP